MDGFGNAPKGAANAIDAAATPNLDKIFAENPRSSLKASGLAVGLPDGQMGNSEVGHTNIGAGRVPPSSAVTVLRLRCPAIFPMANTP